MRRAFLTLTVCLFVGLLCTDNSYAATGLSDSMKHELMRVSDIMYRQGDNNFIVVDAIVDGLIPLGVYYKLSYKNSTITINDNDLPANLASSYNDKALRFIIHNGGDGTSSFSVRCDGAKLSDIFDPNSIMRQSWVHSDTIHVNIAGSVLSANH